MSDMLASSRIAAGVAGPARLLRHRRAHRRFSTVKASVSDHSSDPSHERVDAVIIMGGGLLPGGSLSEWVHLRVEAAAETFRRHDCRIPILCSGAGTPHRPPELNPHGYVRHESTVLAEALLERGVPADCILKESASYDTLGNAYFCLLEHVVPLRWRRPLIVTSAFHMRRSEAAFRGVFRLARQGGLTGAEPRFLATADSGLDPEVLRARAERERESLERFEARLAGMASLADFHTLLFATHKCYSVSRQHEVGLPPEMSEVALKSY